MIDAVFTWVDGNDPIFQKKLRGHERDTEIQGALPQSAVSTRFKQNEELKYSVKLIRKHAPWLRKIFVVTDDQSPAWLTEQVCLEQGINLVDHKEIFRGFEEYLPTFNSQTIEAMLYRIPGLSEHFIYLNDDFFIIKPVQPGEYFLDGMPLIRGRWTWKNRYLAYMERKARRILGKGKGLSGLVGPRPEIGFLGSFRYFRLAHAPYVVKRSTFSQYFKDEDFLRSVIQYRFRNNRQIWPIGYFVNRALRDGVALQKKDSDWEYLDPLARNESLKSFLKRLKEDPAIKHFCVQSLDQFSSSEREVILGFLSNL